MFNKCYPVIQIEYKCSIYQEITLSMFLFIFNSYLFLNYSYRDFNVQISFSNMKFLILDNNIISSVDNFPSILSLQTLSLSKNKINYLSSFINSVKIKFTLLTSLNIFKNPMNPWMINSANYNKYKAFIKNRKY